MHIYFSRIEHYDPGDFIEEETKKEETKKEEENRECLICFQNKCIKETESERFSTIMKNNFDFQKDCECDFWVHTNCLKIWFLQKEMCIICRGYFPKKIHISEDEDAVNNLIIYNPQPVIVLVNPVTFIYFVYYARIALYIFCNIVRIFVLLNIIIYAIFYR